jgi:uncharacterized protein DUF4154
MVVLNRWFVALAIALVGVSIAAVPLEAQSASAPELKAAFLFNFARFTEWPDLPDGSPLKLCVFGDDHIADALEVAVRGQTIEGRGLEVSSVSTDTPMRVCHVLFVGASALRLGTPLLDNARALPILTVSDSGRFAQSTGMVELFVDAGRMRFAINVDAVQRSRLRVSSRLLGLAKVMRDKHVQ